MTGRDKLLEPVRGEVLLRRQARLARASGRPVLVTLPPRAAARRRALAGLDGVRVATVRGAREGMAASIRSGARWARESGATGLMILLGDMPDLQVEDLNKLLQEFDNRPNVVVRASDARGRPGHPVILPARLWGQLTRLRGDAGARSILGREEIRLVALPDARATTDLDTQEDWAAWRARRPPR